MNNELDTGMILGELRGQMRELIHQGGNMGMKVDSLMEQSVAMRDIPARLDQIATRLTTLETEKHMRAGAKSLGEWLLRTPILGWLLALVASGYVIVKDKL